jgi:signal peptidase I
MKYRFLLGMMGFEEHSGNRIHYRLTSRPTRQSKINTKKEEKTSLENTDGDRRFFMCHPCCTSGVDGMLQVFVVLSGSMQPTFHADDVIVTVDTPVHSPQVNDIIIYRSPDNMKSLVTHRIVTIIKDSQGLAFQTKGDANEGVDQYVVYSELVVGRMVVTIPYIGHVAMISHSFLGFLLLVLAPGIVVIGAEVFSIVKKK